MRFVVCFLLLFVAAISDIKLKTISIFIPISGVIAGIVFTILEGLSFNYVAGLLLGLMMILLSLCLKSGFGMGDAMMLLVIGILRGASICIEVLTLSCLSAAIFGILRSILVKKHISIAYIPILTGTLLIVELLGGNK